MSSDRPIVQEVRQRAMEISARFDHDLHRYVQHLRQRQSDPRYRDRIVGQISIVPSTPAQTTSEQKGL
jgi:hypothetical protein